MLRIIMHNAGGCSLYSSYFFFLGQGGSTDPFTTRRETIGIHVLRFSTPPHYFPTSFLGTIL